MSTRRFPTGIYLLMVSAKAPSLRTRPARCGLAAAALGMAAAVGSAEELSVARRTPLRLRRLPPLRTRQGSLEARWSAVDGGTGCLAHTACTGASFRVGRGTRRALGVAGGSSWDGQPNGQGYGAGQEYGAYGGDGEADDRDLYQGGRGGAGSGFDPNQSPVADMSPPGYGSEGMGQVPQQPGNPQSEEVPSQIIAMLVGQTYTSVAVLFFILIFRALHNYELGQLGFQHHASPPCSTLRCPVAPPPNHSIAPADQMENPAKAAFVKLVSWVTNPHLRSRPRPSPRPRPRPFSYSHSHSPPQPPLTLTPPLPSPSPSP